MKNRNKLFFILKLLENIVNKSHSATTTIRLDDIFLDDIVIDDEHTALGSGANMRHIKVQIERFGKLGLRVGQHSHLGHTLHLFFPGGRHVRIVHREHHHCRVALRLELVDLLHIAWYVLLKYRESLNKI